MRYSRQKRNDPQKIESNKSNRAFFEEVAQRCDPAHCRGGILLVGGRDTRALTVRRAQAALRYDRRPSHFSHAAIVVQWNAEHPHKSRGLEVSLEPEASELQVPERNAVTELELARYLDVKHYPNLAFITVSFTDLVEEQDGKKTVVRSGADRKNDVLDAAADPCRQRESFPLWDALGTWAGYAYSPEAQQNPLLRSVPLPAASLIEYAFGAAGVDIVPGASSNHSCPELLWASALHWQEGLSSSVALSVLSVLRDEHGTPLAPLSMKLGPY